MGTRWAAIIVIGLVVAACSLLGKGSLSFELPADWRIEHKTPGGLEFYTLTASTSDDGLLIFSQFSHLGKPEDIPAMVQQLADGFLKQGKKSPEFRLTSEEYHIERFAGEHCQGSYATFQFTNGGANTLLAIFMMSVDGRVWNGYFIGRPDGWGESLKLLKGIKKRN